MCAIIPARSNGSRVHAPLKSRHSARSNAARRSRSIGPSSSTSPGRTPRLVRRSDRRTPSGGSSRIDWNHAPKASSNRRPAWPSVSTRNSGSTRASTGRSRSRSAQNPWMVLTCASSRFCTASSSRAATSGDVVSRRSISSRSRSRSFSSPAAFSVNVTATISRTLARPSARTRTIRFTSSVVLPVPAAASTTSVSSSASRMRRRAASSVCGVGGHGRLLSASRSASRSCGLRRTR